MRPRDRPDCRPAGFGALDQSDHAGFERFLLELSEPARASGLPPASVEPPAPQAMMAAAAEYGIEILGPPGIPA
jgi:hypothetical protein